MASANEEEPVPAPIQLDGEVMCLACHPSRDVVACGLIDGEVKVHSYSATEGNKLLWEHSRHKKSCRALCFSPCGRCLLSASADKSIKSVDVETGKLRRKIPKAHKSAIYSMINTGENFIATGDEDGVLKVWDLRTKTATMEMKENEDYITDMMVDDDNKLLLATSGDATLTCFNIRRKRMDLQSEMFDSDLMCLARCKRGRKVVVGTGMGVLNIFNWGEWGNISDRFPGHPQSVECMVAATQDLICTGSSDGIIRVVHVLPNRFVGVLGEHKGISVEDLALTHDRELLVSASLDQTVSFWSLKGLDQIQVDPNKKPRHAEKHRKLNPSKKDFFSDLASTSAEKDSDEEEDGEGGDDDDDDEDSNGDLDSDDSDSDD